jgi:hypothetical protein
VLAGVGEARKHEIAGLVLGASARFGLWRFEAEDCLGCCPVCWIEWSAADSGGAGVTGFDQHGLSSGTIDGCLTMTIRVAGMPVWSQPEQRVAVTGVLIREALVMQRPSLFAEVLWDVVLARSFRG